MIAPFIIALKIYGSQLAIKVELKKLTYQFNVSVSLGWVELRQATEKTRGSFKSLLAAVKEKLENP